MKKQNWMGQEINIVYNSEWAIGQWLVSDWTVIGVRISFRVGVYKNG